MKHCKVFKNVKLSKAGEVLSYEIRAERLNKVIAPDCLEAGSTHQVVGTYRKPNGSIIYNCTVRRFKCANDCMIGYAKMIKEKSKLFNS